MGFLFLTPVKPSFRVEHITCLSILPPYYPSRQAHQPAKPSFTRLPVLRENILCALEASVHRLFQACPKLLPLPRAFVVRTCDADRSVGFLMGLAELREDV
jgi:hypothetical protein